MCLDRSAVASLRNVLRDKGELTFETREELIASTSDILTFEYLLNLELWRCTAMDDYAETKYWDEKISKEVCPYREALKLAIEAESNFKWFGIIPKREIIIDFRHMKLIKSALQVIGQNPTSSCGIESNVSYKIDLVHNQLRKIYRS